MLEIFASWEWWQIAITAVFGTVWIVFIILDQRRKIAAKKLKARREQELREQGYSDEQIEEIMQQRNFHKCSVYAYSAESGSGKSRCFVSNQKDGEK